MAKKSWETKLAESIAEAGIEAVESAVKMHRATIKATNAALDKELKATNKDPVHYYGAREK